MIKIELQSIKGDEVTFSLSVSLSEFLGSFINSQRSSSVSPSLSPSLTSNFADTQYIKDFESRILSLFDEFIILFPVKEAVKQVRLAMSSHPWGHYQAVLDVIRKNRKEYFTKKGVK